MEWKEWATTITMCLSYGNGGVNPLGETHLQLTLLMTIFTKTNCNKLWTSCHASCSPLGIARAVLPTGVFILMSNLNVFVRSTHDSCSVYKHTHTHTT